jgi:dienelactone hydrolase
MPELRQVTIPDGDARVHGDLTVPGGATGLVLFAHGSGSGRHSPRNRFVARGLNDAGLATLLMDLLTEEEDRIDVLTRQYRFDIPLLARRLEAAMSWLATEPDARRLDVGLFGASTGAAAALVAAAHRPEAVGAVVSRGGRPDLAGPELAAVRAPTLLIVGGLDDVVIELNEQARRALRCETRLEIVPGATHLFEEPGALERVVALAREWFEERLSSDQHHDSRSPRVAARADEETS